MERRSYSHRVIFTALILSLVAAFACALLIYEKFIKTNPVAALHLPQEVDYALRLDVENVVSYEPFRVHLLKLFEEGRISKEPRVKHLERKTTLELGIDSREMVFAVLPGEAWLIMLGGVFRRDGVLKGAAQLLKDEGVSSQIEGDLLVLDSGRAFAVCQDGTLVVGSDAASVRSAISISPAAREPGAYQATLNDPGAIISFYRPFAEGPLLGSVRAGKSFRGSLSGPRLLDASHVDHNPLASEIFLPEGWRKSLASQGNGQNDVTFELSREDYERDVAQFADRLRQLLFSEPN